MAAWGAEQAGGLLVFFFFFFFFFFPLRVQGLGVWGYMSFYGLREQCGLKWNMKLKMELSLGLLGCMVGCISRGTPNTDPLNTPVLIIRAGQKVPGMLGTLHRV